MSEVAQEVPKGTAFTMLVPLDRNKEKTAKFYLKEVDESVFLAVKALIEKGKDFEGVRMFIGALRIGGDNVDLLKDNFVANQSASLLVMELLKPVEGELKKN